MLAGPRQDRFESLDVLRGVAVLGIFSVNILAMAQPPAAFSDPSLNPQFHEPGGAFWWSIMSTFFQFKFITIFSALFGAGVILMVGEEKPSPKFGVHYRRMMWLAVIGAIHGFVIWYGDILLPYAISGMIVVLMRRWRPRTLLIVAGILLLLFPALIMLQHVVMSSLPPEKLAEIAEQNMMHATPEQVQEQIAAYRGTFPGRLAAMLPTSIQFEMMQGLFLIPRHLGVMMCGMAFFKMGFFTLRWSFMTYLVSGLITLAIGLAGSYYTTTQSLAVEFDMMMLLPAQAALMVGSLFHSFGYSALIMALCKLPGLGVLRMPFAAAGQMALTNYLMCSIIGVLYYWGPPGLGKIGSVTFPEMAQFVGLMWVAMLIWSPVWLTFFRFGPFEWLWRSLTYWKLQPLAR